MGVAELGAEAGADAPGRGYHPLSGGTLGLAFEDGTGVATTLGSARSQLYEEQITRVPIEHSYIVNGVEFDGYDGFALIDAKGPGYANPIKGGWSAEPEGKYGLLNTAQRQVKAVRATGTDTPIQWHIAEKETFNELFSRQKFGKFPTEIELFYTPPN